MRAVAVKRQQRFAVEVKQQLLRRILSGKILPGRRIVELDVAAEFGVSQMSVREALNELESAGLVETEYYRGSRVRVIPAAEVRDLYLMRASLERLAANMVVANVSDVVDQLREILDKATNAAQVNDRFEFRVQERAFRQALVDASRSRPLTELWRPIALQLELAEQQHAHRVAMQRSTQVLCKVIEALESRDGERAGRILARSSQHILSTRDRAQCGAA